MTGDRTNNKNYYSDQHKWLLLWCAKRAKAYLYRNNIVVEIDDLVNVGWLRCLRKVKEEDLRGKSRYLLMIMVEYGFKLCKSISDFKPDVYIPPDQYDHTYRVENIDEIVNLCSDLPPKWLAVIKYRFFDGKSLSEVANLLGVSGERIRQIQQATLEKIRERCGVQ